MQSGFIGAAIGLVIRLVFGVATLGLSCSLLAQQTNMTPRTAATVPSSAIPAVRSSAIPDAPTPQIDIAAIDPQSAQSTNSSAQQISSSKQSSTSQPTGTQETEQQKAAEQIKAQEHQRIGGILPSFNVTYLSNAASMSARQKIGLAFRSATDPYAFGLAFIVAGISEARDDDTGFGWGPEGYFKRSGAAYLDAFDGAMLGNGFLPALLHQDPRYFRLGHGTFHHRFFYALASSVICKHDNTGKWQPNYSNVGGNLIAGAISNLYYPSQNSGWGQTIDHGVIVTGEGAFGNVFQEFWPDISRKLFHRDPTHGLDARAAAADKSKKIDKIKDGASGNAAAQQ
jgi:hypothetical protein